MRIHEKVFMSLNWLGNVHESKVLSSSHCKTSSPHNVHVLLGGIQNGKGSIEPTSQLYVPDKSGLPVYLVSLTTPRNPIRTSVLPTSVYRKDVKENNASPNKTPGSQKMTWTLDPKSSTLLP